MAPDAGRRGSRRDLQRIVAGDLTATPRAARELGSVIYDLRDLLRRILIEAGRGASRSAGWRTMNEVAWAMANISEATLTDA